MSVGVQRDLTHPAEQLSKWRVTGKISAQHQRIDKKADQSLGFLAGSAGDRRAHHNVFLAAVAVEQSLERRQQGHEQSGALALT